MGNTPEVWSDEHHEEFARRLELERQALVGTAVATDEELATLEHHEAGAVEEDAATQATGVLLSRLEARVRHELDDIDDALARLATGMYGTCEGCGGRIPLGRLRAMPAARHCVDCQRQHESQ